MTDLHQRIEDHFRQVDAAQAAIVKDQTGVMYSCGTCGHTYWRTLMVINRKILQAMCPCNNCAECPYCGVINRAEQVFDPETGRMLFP